MLQKTLLNLLAMVLAISTSIHPELVQAGAFVAKNNLCSVQCVSCQSEFSSYSLPMKHFELPATLLCKQQGARGGGGGNADMLLTDEAPEQPAQFLIFKTARSGSTWFHGVLSKALAAQGREVMSTWEPFCRDYCPNAPILDSCQDLANHTTQWVDTYAFHSRLKLTPSKIKMLKRGCALNGNPTSSPTQTESIRTLLDRSVKCPKMPAGVDRCSPANWCWRDLNMSPASYAKRVNVISLNPRFPDRVVWKDIGLKAREAVVVNLRRTNLVRQAYSKFHHGGVQTGTGKCKKKLLNKKNDLKGAHRRVFTFDALLCGVWHYAIGDQEWASTAAIKTAASVGRAHPFVIFYEDLLEHEPIVKAQLLDQHLASLAALAGNETSSSSSTHNENEKVRKRTTRSQKVHTAAHMCSYEDVDCVGSELAGLSADLYPCLWKQFHATESSLWGVPLLPNGTLSVFGDCKKLEPLSLEHPRRLSELY